MNSPEYCTNVQCLFVCITDGLRYWTLNGEPHEILPHYKVLGNLQQTVASAEVEMTAYALLTFAAKRDIAYSLPIVKWLTKQRNSLGGFSSTQVSFIIVILWGVDLLQSRFRNIKI